MMRNLFDRISIHIQTSAQNTPLRNDFLPLDAFVVDWHMVVVNLQLRG